MSSSAPRPIIFPKPSFGSNKIVNVEWVSGDRQWTAAATALARKGKVPEPLRPLVLTDTHFAALGHLPHLRRLKIIAELDASQAGLRNLARLTSLEAIILDNASGRSTGGVTDDALRFLSRLPRLRTLHLEGNPITDAGLTRLGWPVGLTSLNLSGTKTTDAGLLHLAQIASLQELVVLDCAVTASAIKRVRQSLPKCRVRARRFDGL